MAARALPTRREEDWRYSDIDALATVWPLPPAEAIRIAEGDTRALALLDVDGDADRVRVRDYAIDIAAGGSFAVYALVGGARLARVRFDVTLHEGARFDLNAAIIGGGEETLEIVTKVNHAEPGAISRQTVRAVLGERATGSYLGKVAVARGAQATDAEQSFKAMLLDRAATANAKPELEIFADDVKCAHGATVGELDKTALFYCAARGIDPATAQTLLLQAFVAGLFDDMADEGERERFEAAALARLGALA